MPEDSDIEQKFTRVYSKLSITDLTEGLDHLNGIDSGILDPNSGSNDFLFLDYYTLTGIRNILEAYGILEMLAHRGFPNPRIYIEQEPNGLNVLKLLHEEGASTPILDLAVDRVVQKLPVVGEIPVLKIGWLELRNPLAEFSEKKPPFPGQRSPGLGVGWAIFALLKRICKRLSLQAITTSPAYLHNAILYAAEFDCVEPADQGRLFAMVRDLPARSFGSISFASWALFLGHAIECSEFGEEVAKWSDPPMVWTLGQSTLGRYFSSPEYLKPVNDAMCAVDYQVDQEDLRNELASKGILPLNAKELETSINYYGWA